MQIRVVVDHRVGERHSRYCPAALDDWHEKATSKYNCCYKSSTPAVHYTVPGTYVHTYCDTVVCSTVIRPTTISTVVPVSLHVLPGATVLVYYLTQPRGNGYKCEDVAPVLRREFERECISRRREPRESFYGALDD